MSVTVQYLFNADDEPASLVGKLNGVLGCSLAPEPGDSSVWYNRFCGMEFSLVADHMLINADELRFEDYRYQLGTRTPNPDGNLRGIQVEVMAIAAYVLHARLGIHRGMLSYEVGSLLADYDRIDGR